MERDSGLSLCCVASGCFAAYRPRQYWELSPSFHRAPITPVHPFNHSAQGLWLLLTLRWWKWIKVITDSQQESWADIKKLDLIAFYTSSCVLWCGDPLLFSLQFFHRSTHTPTQRPTVPTPAYPCITLSDHFYSNGLGCFFHAAIFCISQAWFSLPFLSVFIYFNTLFLFEDLSGHDCSGQSTTLIS